MAEKVIFEFRAGGDEGGCTFEFGRDLDHWFGSHVSACCQMMGVPVPKGAEGSHAGWPKRHRHFRSRIRSRVRHHVRENMRETLDFFEQMYDDLFGGEEQGGSGEPEPD